jgi:cytochrome c-type biogenesis protein CcmH
VPADQTAAGGEKTKAASVNELLTGLEQRLEENPDDAKNWLLLAKSYDHLGRHVDAADAYAKAVDLGLSDKVLEARLK